MLEAILSTEAFIVSIDEALIRFATDRNSDRAMAFKDEMEATLEDAGLRGVKLGLVTQMTSHDVVATCEIIFGRHFIKRFDVVIPSDHSFMGWLGLPRIASALTILGVPSHRALAVVCNEADAQEAYETGISQRWYVDEPDETAPTEPYSYVGNSAHHLIN